MAVSEIRQATVKRKTSETDIALFLRIDGSGEAEVDTGIGFFDHMLKSFAKHGLFDLKLKVTGDLIVDCHHTIEDVGIVLGEAIPRSTLFPYTTLFRSMATLFFLWMKHLSCVP